MIIIYYSLVILVFIKNLQSLNTYSNKRFNEWTFVTAHNANLNWEDSRVLPELANQNVGIDNQLNYGVRGFMLDIDWKVCSVFEKIFNSCSCEGVRIFYFYNLKNTYLFRIPLNTVMHVSWSL